MAIITVTPSEQNTWSGEYTPNFLECKGFVDRSPVLASQIDSLVEAVVSSWKTFGPNAGTLAAKLDSIKGNGKQTFKQVTYSTIKTAIICGDAFLEVVHARKNSLDIENLMQLP